MSEETEAAKTTATIKKETPTLQAAAEQSIILPTQAFAKAGEESAPSEAALQIAAQQCASLPQNLIVVRESVESKTEQG